MFSNQLVVLTVLMHSNDGARASGLLWLDLNLNYGGCQLVLMKQLINHSLSSFQSPRMLYMSNSLLSRSLQRPN